MSLIDIGSSPKLRMRLVRHDVLGGMLTCKENMIVPAPGAAVKRKVDKLSKISPKKCSIKEIDGNGKG